MVEGSIVEVSVGVGRFAVDSVLERSIQVSREVDVQER